MLKKVSLLLGAIAIANAAAPALAKQSPAVSLPTKLSDTPQKGVVRAIFTKFLAGGPEMTAALKEILIKEPSLAKTVAAEAKSGNLDQKIATGRAIAEARRALLDMCKNDRQENHRQDRDLQNTDRCNRDGAKEIESATLLADAQTLAAYEAALGDVVAADNGGSPSGGSGSGSSGGFGGGGGGNSSAAAPSGGGSVSPN